MMQATSSAIRARHVALAAAVAWLALSSSRVLSAQNAPPAARPGFSALQGYVIDSVHNVPLANAVVTVEGSGRSVKTTSEGQFHIDSIPPGPHRVAVNHPLLDTLGLSMRTPEYPFAAGQTHDLDVSIPGGERLASMWCTDAQRARGPAIMVGFVRDPDTKGPAVGAKVSLVYTPVDIIGRKLRETLRESPIDSLGFYRICSLPADMVGKVQVFRGGVSSGEVPIAVENGLALRAFSIVAHHQSVAEVKNDSGKVRMIAKGSARVTGKVVDKGGRPLDGARVMLQGGMATAVTRANGEFTLDSLPSGTQALVVRKLGYGVTERAVELASNQATQATVTMEEFVSLATVRVEAAQDKALSDIGYLQRKQMGMGNFLDGNQINHESMSFSDVMRIVPGLRIVPTGDGRTSVIQDSRSATGGCVTYYVDGSPWQTMTPGDIDSFVRPNELVAIEVYHGSQAPPQYTQPGQSGCAVIVAWTQARVRPNNSSKRP